MKDRISQNPGRVLVKPENGNAQFYATLERADNPIQEGDALNKANLLTDETAALLGLGENAVPNDAFGSFGLHTWRRRTEESGYDFVVSRTATTFYPTMVNGQSNIFYSDTISMTEDNKIVLDNYSTMRFLNNSDLSSLAGKYIYGAAYEPTQNVFTTVYKCGQNVERVGSSTSGLGVSDVYETAIEWVDRLGEWEYISSANRNTYPDSGIADGVRYEYLGAPLGNARDAYGLRLHWWKRRTEDSGYVAELGFIASKTFYVDNTYRFHITSGTSYTLTDGVVTIDNPTSGDQMYTYSQLASVTLKNQYFTIDNDTTIYYCAGGETTYSPSNGNYYGTFTNLYQVNVVEKTNVGEEEYVSSLDRNAYPDSGTEGIFSYQYLGVPFENAREGAKVVTGSYVGTGKYGSSNPCSLTFERMPKLVYVKQNGGDNVECIFTNSTYANAIYSSTAHYLQYVTFSGNTVSWYNTNGTYQQMNNSGNTYYYYAIL